MASIRVRDTSGRVWIWDGKRILLADDNEFPTSYPARTWEDVLKVIDLGNYVEQK